MVSELDSGLSGLGLSSGKHIMLRSWARHFTLTVPLSAQIYIYTRKWVPANLF